MPTGSRFINMSLIQKSPEELKASKLIREVSLIRPHQHDVVVIFSDDIDYHEYEVIREYLYKAHPSARPFSLISLPTEASVKEMTITELESYVEELKQILVRRQLEAVGSLSAITGESEVASGEEEDEQAPENDEGTQEVIAIKQMAKDKEEQFLGDKLGAKKKGKK